MPQVPQGGIPQQPGTAPQGPPPNIQPQGPPPGIQPQSGIPQQVGPPSMGAQGPPPGIPTQGPPHSMPQMPQSLSQQNITQQVPQQINQAQPHGMNMGQIPSQQFQQPGAPPASPQVTQGQQNGEIQTAELISFD